MNPDQKKVEVLKDRVIVLLYNAPATNIQQFSDHFSYFIYAYFVRYI